MTTPSFSPMVASSPTSYWCPYCGSEFPAATTAKIVLEHVLGGSAACRTSDTVTPAGFWWECGGCGFLTDDLPVAREHDCG